jgi:hypothetical protein
VAFAIGSCSLADPAVKGPNVPRPYPDGCQEFSLSARRCDAIVRWAVRQAGDANRPVDAVDLLGDPGCEAEVGPGVMCFRTMAFVVRVRAHFVDGGSTEQSVFCGVGGQYSILCTETPEILVSGPTLDGSGYRDVPCANDTGEGCGLPLPSADPAAAAAARPLRIAAREIPIDRVGHYDVELGHAVLRNGVVATSAIELANKLTQDVAMSENGILVDVTSIVPGAPPFHNYYDRGWHAGPEEVVLTLRFDVVDFTPGAVLQIRDVDLE